MSRRIRYLAALAVVFVWLWPSTEANGELGTLYRVLDTTLWSPPGPCGPVEYVRSNYVNLLAYPDEGVDQAEVSIASNSDNALELLIGAIAIIPYPVWFRQGNYPSQDGGYTWDGLDSLPGQQSESCDPAVAYDSGGNAYYCYIEQNITNRYYHLDIRKSLDG